ncbi:MAG: shikimate kinase / 3-dehydroquinate synthase, partial [Acetobacteraceae bacterium]|nr:shikimate kinase / 3-dehydroquinate synthase [Acetobacteraceae bacterium]
MATSPASTTKKKMRIIEAPEIGFRDAQSREQIDSRAIACSGADVLTSGIMTRNTALRETIPIPDTIAGRSIVLVGLMGAGKTSIGRRLAARLGLPFRDADQEIELAAGCTIPELFARYGETAFRDGERRVIRRLLAGDPMVVAFGGGAFMDQQTRESARAEAVSVWLRCSLPTLVRRVAGRDNRPLLAGRDREETLRQLMEIRYPVYAEADVIVDCGDEPPDVTTTGVMNALIDWKPARRLHVVLASASYDVVIGDNLLARAGALLAPKLPQKRAVVVTDQNVAGLHLQTLLDGLAETAITATSIVVKGGEASKSMDSYLSVVDQLLEARVERRTAVIALGGGVVGDLAGFAAATTLRGLPFIQIPTTLLSQVDSSVGGKTGVNTRRGKNLVGAFYQPRIVLADTATLGTLPPRELKAGYAEIAKAGLIGDAAFFAWCERHGQGVVSGNREAQAEAIKRACAFKAAVVGDDEREEKPNDGRALLNLGHTFGHALEAEYGYDGGLLHGEGVAIGLGLAFKLSARLGLCAAADAERVIAHVSAVGLPADLSMLNRRFSAETLIGHMRRDKKMRDGALHFVLTRGIGQ